MRSLLLLLALIASTSLCTAQQYNYRFRVATVDSHAIAKPLVSILRDRYNTPEEPKRFFPKFDDATDEFVVTSSLVLTEEELAAVFQEFSYQLSAFTRTQSTAAIKTEDE